MQTKRPPQELTATVSFRVPEYRRKLLQALAAREGLLVSEWLRRRVEAVLREEFGGGDGAVSGR